MSQQPDRDPIAEAFEDMSAIDEAIQRGVIEAALEHRRNGTAIVIWRDERVVELRGEEIDRELERVYSEHPHLAPQKQARGAA